MEGQHFSHLAVGVIDFSHSKWEAADSKDVSTIFDLASLTKPLTLATCFLKTPKLLKEENLFHLLNHRASLPVGGRLSKESWRELLLSYPLNLSKEDVYSDYSALRLQLELEKKIGHPYDFLAEFKHSELTHWMDLSPGDKKKCAPTGVREGKVIQGVCHDDNAFVLREKLCHAGLFATLKGLCETLLNLQNKFDLCGVMEEAYKNGEQEGRRFIRGWDRVENPEETLAGQGASEWTFGHLGFTGTSIWIDVKKKKGHVILTNATENYWHDRKGLNTLRKKIGQAIW